MRIKSNINMWKNPIKWYRQRKLIVRTQKLLNYYLNNK